jgi:type III secretory pathway component EscT
VTTIIGWSIIGNFAGLAAVQYLEARQNSIKSLRLVNKREFMKVGVFLGTVAAFTFYGYGSARQTFVRQKMEIVEKYSVESSDK